jgi:hypothetical protein
VQVKIYGKGSSHSLALGGSSSCRRAAGEMTCPSNSLRFFKAVAGMRIQAQTERCDSCHSPLLDLIRRRAEDLGSEAVKCAPALQL